MEHIFNKHRELISNAYPSVFTKDDVISLINRIEHDLLDTGLNNGEMIETIKEEVLTIVDNFDYESYIDLELYDREITAGFEPGSLVKSIEKAFGKSGV